MSMPSHYWRGKILLWILNCGGGIKILHYSSPFTLKLHPIHSWTIWQILFLVFEEFLDQDVLFLAQTDEIIKAIFGRIFSPLLDREMIPANIWGSLNGQVPILLEQWLLQEISSKGHILFKISIVRVSQFLQTPVMLLHQCSTLIIWGDNSISSQGI